MKRVLTSAIAAFGFFIGAGCNKSEPGGHPKSSASTSTNAETFTLSPPRMSTSLKPKESKAVKIDINRKDAFKEAVTLTATDVPPGLSVDEKTKVADSATKEVTFTVTAAENAQAADYIIKVSGKPEKPGKETITDVKITVDKP